MKNCLVTKLKEVVDNDNLKVYNGIKLNVVSQISPTTSTQYLYVVNAVIETPDTYPMTDSMHLANGTYKALIKNKYSMTELYFGSAVDGFDISDLEYCINLTKIGGNGKKNGDIKYLAKLINLTVLSNFNNNQLLVGNISNLKDLTQLTSLNIAATAITGELSSLANLVSLTSININNTEITGDIASLGNLTSLQELVIGNASISGSIESFVAAQVAAGRTSFIAGTGNSWPGLMSTCTFGGAVRESSPSYTWPSWDGANKIIIYVGASTYNTCTKIYAKGATAEEIAAWEDAGKTVIEID